jgi:hypothetical protein
MLPVEVAAIWSLLGGYMLLPSGLTVDVPLLPPIDKMGIATISTLLLCWMKGTPTPRPRQSMLVYLFCAAFVLAPIFTSLGNSYELHAGRLSIPGFYPVDGLKVAGRNLLALGPLYIGTRYLYTDAARRMLLKALASAMVFYSVPMLFEVRMSPQLHRWIYGYFPHDAFNQQIRDGGFRPVVFLDHGLTLAEFTAICAIAAVILARAKTRVLRWPAGAISTYLGGLLLLCKSLGPIIYLVLFAPLIMLTRPRLWVKIACALSLVVCAYPLLRNHGLAPTQLVSQVASSVSADRSASLDVRLVNEEQLLQKANEKPMFGWGTWGRNRVFDQWTGKDISITDGGWIVQFGTYGWFGYLALFGLLAAAMFRAHRAIGPEVTPATIELGGLTLLLTVYVVDQIPNASPMSLTLLVAGSIAAFPAARVVLQRRRSSAPPMAPTPLATFR